MRAWFLHTPLASLGFYIADALVRLDRLVYFSRIVSRAPGRLQP